MCTYLIPSSLVSSLLLSIALRWIYWYRSACLSSLVFKISQNSTEFHRTIFVQYGFLCMFLCTQRFVTLDNVVLFQRGFYFHAVSCYFRLNTCSFHSILFDFIRFLCVFISLLRMILVLKCLFFCFKLICDIFNWF